MPSTKSQNPDDPANSVIEVHLAGARVDRARVQSRGLRRTASRLLRIVFAAIAVLSSLTCGESRRTSVVLISMDTARADHFGCYGYALDTSPVIDGLAREGVLFDDAFTHAVNTNPAHASLFTGLDPIQHGSRRNNMLLREGIDTMGTVLSASGYETAAFVSGLTMTAKQTALDRGFKVYDDTMTAWTIRPAAETVDKALDWLESVPSGQPYFLFVHLYDPHGPYAPPEGFAERFREGRHAEIGPDDTVASYQVLPKRDGSGDSRDPLDYISAYDGEIAYADSQIARLLERTGSDVLVIFTADHGETLLDRYYFFDHGARLNDEQIRVPLILRFPERKLNTGRIGGLVGLTDIFPTLLAYLGLTPPHEMSGRNLIPYIEEGIVSDSIRVFSEARATDERVADRGMIQLVRGSVFSVRTNRYKLIRYPTVQAPTFELFDLQEDPGELSNLAAEQPERVTSMAALIEAFSRGQGSAEPREMDPETLERLRSLGYVN